jgi:hypothetical protein
MSIPTMAELGLGQSLAKMSEEEANISINKEL